jgi:phage-related protein
MSFVAKAVKSVGKAVGNVVSGVVKAVGSVVKAVVGVVSSVISFVAQPFMGLLGGTPDIPSSNAEADRQRGGGLDGL